jgi:hypothetical protein
MARRSAPFSIQRLVTRLVQGGHYLQFCEGAMPRELLAATGAAEPRNRDIMPLPLVHGHPI